MNHFFGQNLKTIRLDKKLSQAELGKQFYKGQKTIGNWETGYSEPCLEELVAISEFFDIDIDSLIKQEIKRDNPKVKASRNRHKENGAITEKVPVVIAEVKRMLQQTAGKNITTEDGELTWRDKYILLLENQLSEATTYRIPKETVHDLLTQVLAIQKMIAGLSLDTSNPV